MAAGWPDVTQRIFADGQIVGTEPDVLSAIRSWHQQQSSICVWLGRELQRHVSLHLNRSHRESQSMRLLEDAEEFVTTRQLRATFNSSALARPIDVIADALRRNVICRCSIGAPQDRRRYQSRINWLLEQLPENNLGETMIHIAWDNGQRTSVALKRLRKDENEGRVEGALPIAFELSRSFDLGQRFAGPKLFVEGVDSAVSSFCDSIARHLRAWQPRAVRAEQEPETEQEAAPDRVAIREANIPGGKVRIFDDGSIEHQTAAGTSWFRSFAELEHSLRASDGLKSRKQSDSADANGRDTCGASASAPSTEASPGPQATSTNIIS